MSVTGHGEPPGEPPPDTGTDLEPPAWATTDSELLLRAQLLRAQLLSVPLCLLARGPQLRHSLWRYEAIWLPLLAEHENGVLRAPPDVYGV